MICTKKNSKTIRPKSFVEMRASLTPAESDILDIIFFLMDQGQYDEKTSSFTIDAHDFYGLFVNNKGNVMSVKRIYERLVNGADGLYNLDLQFSEDTDTVKSCVKFRVLAAEAYNSGNYQIIIQLTPIMCSIMKEQKRKTGYALYDLQYQFSLKGEYSKRLYPMMSKFRNTGKRYDNVKELREKIGIPQACTQSRFISYIRKSIDEINEKTNLDVKIELVMHGKRGGNCLDGIVWYITEKPVSEVGLPEDEKKKCAEKIKDLLSGCVSSTDAERIAKCSGYDYDKVFKAKEVLESYKKPVDDVTGFFLTAIKQKWKPGRKAAGSQKQLPMQRDYKDVDLEHMLLKGF